MLRSALVIRCTPRSDALETENVIAAIQHAELSTRSQHVSEANLTLGIIFSIITPFVSRVLFAHLVSESAAIAILATIGLEEHADSLLWSTLMLGLPLT